MQHRNGNYTKQSKSFSQHQKSTCQVKNLKIYNTSGYSFCSISVWNYRFIYLTGIEWASFLSKPQLDIEGDRQINKTSVLCYQGLYSLQPYLTHMLFFKKKKKKALIGDALRFPLGCFLRGKKKEYVLMFKWLGPKSIP